jgi:2-phospho-L-lactate guanylyltransferase
MTLRTPVIIPVKALPHAKQRLAGVLGAIERRLLVQAMLADVLDTLGTVDAVGSVVVVTPDTDVARCAERDGVRVLMETDAGGLNRAIVRGLRNDDVASAGRALILPGDVPLATPSEIAAVIEAGTRRDGPRVTLVPSLDGGGTNAMLLAPPDVIAPCYGAESFVQHLAAAVARRVDTEVIELPGLACDIDMPADLERLVQARADAPRYAFLSGSKRTNADGQGTLHDGH